MAYSLQAAMEFDAAKSEALGDDQDHHCVVEAWGTEPRFCGCPEHDYGFAVDPDSVVEDSQGFALWPSES